MLSLHSSLYYSPLRHFLINSYPPFQNYTVINIAPPLFQLFHADFHICSATPTTSEQVSEFRPLRHTSNLEEELLLSLKIIVLAHIVYILSKCPSVHYSIRSLSLIC